MPTRSKQLAPVITVLFVVMSACGIFSPRPAAPQALATTQRTATNTRPVSPVPSRTASLTPTHSPTSTLPPTLLPSQTSTITSTPPPASALRVVYVDGARNLWVWDEGKEPVLLANTGDIDRVRMSQDGSRVAVTRTTNQVVTTLWVINTDGSGGYQVMSEAQIQVAGYVTGAYVVIIYQMIWIPGTHTLAISTRPVFTGLENAINRDMITIDTDTGKHTVIYKQGEGGIFFFSPNGSQMALVKPDRIDLAKPDGNNLRSVLVDPQPNPAKRDFTFFAWPSWAKDSSHMLVALPGTFIGEKQPVEVAIWKIPTDGNKAAPVGNISISPYSYPIFSPDLSRVAFFKPLPDGSSTHTSELHIAQIGFSETTLQTSQQVAVFETWSPDSTRFVIRQEQPGGALLGTIQSTTQPLTDMPDAENIHWVNDNQVIFLYKNGQTWELRIGPPTGASTVIASFPVGKHSPSYDYKH